MLPHPHPAEPSSTEVIKKDREWRGMHVDTHTLPFTCCNNTPANFAGQLVKSGLVKRIPETFTPAGAQPQAASRRPHAPRRGTLPSLLSRGGRGVRCDPVLSSPEVTQEQKKCGNRQLPPDSHRGADRMGNALPKSVTHLQRCLPRSCDSARVSLTYCTPQRAPWRSVRGLRRVWPRVFS